jgi:hypothetical protein
MSIVTLKEAFRKLEKGSKFVVVNQTDELPNSKGLHWLLCVEAVEHTSTHAQNGVRQFWIPADLLE